MLTNMRAPTLLAQVIHTSQCICSGACQHECIRSIRTNRYVAVALSQITLTNTNVSVVLPQVVLTEQLTSLQMYQPIVLIATWGHP